MRQIKNTSSGIKAKKNLGQNFLIDEEALTDIARSLDIAGRHIIEVGPGYGALTNYILSHHPETLDLVELDPDMIEILDERYMGDEVAPTILGEDNVLIKTTPVAIHHQDVLKYTPQYENYSVIANIPYYITSPILFHFLYPETPFVKGDVTKWQRDFVSENTEKNPLPPPSAPPLQRRFIPPEVMVIMMQEEVGEKILAGRNKTPHHSYLSLAMELACTDIEIVQYVGRESFDPAPRVDSIVLKFSVRESRDREKEEELLKLWRIAFTHPRKTLMSNLRWSHYDIETMKKWLSECGYDEKIRAEAVRKEDWERFSNILT
jgi:16S rRNA (adenine1518-N6/adenine1519-N6)-dimethyltransferase